MPKAKRASKSKIRASATPEGGSDHPAKPKPSKAKQPEDENDEVADKGEEDESDHEGVEDVDEDEDGGDSDPGEKDVFEPGEKPAVMESKGFSTKGVEAGMDEVVVPRIPSNDPGSQFPILFPLQEDMETHEDQNNSLLGSEKKGEELRDPPAYHHPHTYLPVPSLPSHTIVQEAYQNMMATMPKFQHALPNLVSLSHPTFLNPSLDLFPIPPFSSTQLLSSAPHSMSIVTPTAIFPKQLDQHQAAPPGTFFVFKTDPPPEQKPEGGYDWKDAEVEKELKKNAGLRNHPKEGSRNLPKEAVEHLKNWLLEHSDQPYPSEEEKERLATLLGISVPQINNWFINGRRRILQTKGIVYEKKKGSESMWSGPGRSGWGEGGSQTRDTLIAHIDDVTQKTNAILDSVVGPQTPSVELQRFSNSMDWVRSVDFESHLLEVIKEGLEQAATKK